MLVGMVGCSTARLLEYARGSTSWERMGKFDPALMPRRHQTVMINAKERRENSHPLQVATSMDVHCTQTC